MENGELPYASKDILHSQFTIIFPPPSFFRQKEQNFKNFYLFLPEYQILFVNLHPVPVLTYSV
ncbi:MAG: hypothetical protein LBU42_02845, partial [Prevotellaceae bacterium]|nr:hypothetical protein [Prevotellaceae bacterium]